MRRIASAQHEDERYVPETDPQVLAKLAEWQDIKFGLLMHWGPYSQWGIVESWSICAEDEGWCKRSLDDYIEYKRRYEGLQTTFNPVAFDPARWARAARDAGMKYVVFTTKHHDGFSMFDTKYTDYKVTSPQTPFHANPKANIAKEIFDAFRGGGLPRRRLLLQARLAQRVLLVAELRHAGPQRQLRSRALSRALERRSWSSRTTRCWS